MNKINLLETKANEGSPNCIVIPVPARVRNKRYKKIHTEESKTLLSLYKLSNERYKEMSGNKEEFQHGEVHIVRDADFGSLQIEDPNTKVEDIIDRIENHGRTIVLLPIKTREDKEINPHIYLSSLRALANFIKENEEVLENFKIINIPSFETFQEHISKVEEIFNEINVEIFVCLGTKPDDILSSA